MSTDGKEYRSITYLFEFLPIASGFAFGGHYAKIWAVSSSARCPNGLDWDVSSSP